MHVYSMEQLVRSCLPPIHSHLQQTLFWTLEENKYQTLHKKMKFSITDFLFNYDQIRRKLMRA